jgi:hypothetical protein
MKKEEFQALSFKEKTDMNMAAISKFRKAAFDYIQYLHDIGVDRETAKGIVAEVSGDAVTLIFAKE